MTTAAAADHIALKFVLLTTMIGILFCGSAMAVEIINPELVSVSEDGFTLSWETSAPAPTEIAFDDNAYELNQTSSDDAQTGVHHLLPITGLDSDTLYYYEIIAPDDTTKGKGQFSPGWVRTLKTPDGDFLFSFAQINDTHVGEETAGLLSIGDFSLTPGFTWDDPVNPYWLFTNQQAVSQINALDVDFVIHKGDVTADADDRQYEWALEIFGALDAEIYYARGNHDRVQHGEDYFVEMLGVDPTDYYFDQGMVRFVILDSNDENGLGDVTQDQIEWLAQIMDDALAFELKVMIFAHHSFSPQALFWAVNPQDGRAITELLSGYPNFIGMFAGHSHRARALIDSTAGDAPFVETPSTKEYPMGFSLTRVYECGYTQTFYRSHCDECQQWAQMTRGEYFGMAPWLLFGQTTDRNFTYIYPECREPVDDDDDDDTPAPDGDDNEESDDGDTADDEDGCGC